ncbi:CTL-like protein 1, partial [Armadillidium vulgare]
MQILLTIVYLLICFLQGDPDRVIHGYDNYGNVCGQVNQHIKGVPQSGKNKTGFPYVNVAVQNGKKTKTCVHKCPD